MNRLDPARPRGEAEREGGLDGLPAGVSVVVPCYNSQGSLEPLVEGLGEVLPRCAPDHEVILVNDGSADATWEVIRRLAGRYDWVRGINLMRNYGQHNATLCGVRSARYAITVTIDDDLQTPPSEIPALLRKLDEGADLVYGSQDRAAQAFYRSWLSWLMRLAVALAARQRIPRDLSSFRAFRTSLRRAFTDFKSPQLLLDVLLGWGTTKIAAITVRHRAREIGRSNYTFLQLVNTALMLWTGYTTVPLRIASLIGFAFVIFGVAILIHVLRVYFTIGSFPGFPFLASTIAIFGGVQLFTLGIIGEYLARMFSRSLDQPVYVVERRVGEAGTTPHEPTTAGRADSV